MVGYALSSFVSGYVSGGYYLRSGGTCILHNWFCLMSCCNDEERKPSSLIFYEESYAFSQFCFWTALYWCLCAVKGNGVVNFPVCREELDKVYAHHCKFLAHVCGNCDWLCQLFCHDSRGTVWGFVWYNGMLSDNDFITINMLLNRWWWLEFGCSSCYLLLW